MEQMGFSQQNSQQVPIPFSILAKKVKVKQSLVNSSLITMSYATDVEGLLQVTELQLFNSFGIDTKALVCVIPSAVTLGWPVFSQIDSVYTVRH